MQQLQYHQPKATKNKVIITADDIVIGSVESTGFLRRKTVTCLYDKSWNYVRKGLIRTQITVSDASGKAIAVLRQPALRQKSSLEIGSKTYTFMPQGIHLKTQFVWRDSDESTLVTYKLGGMIKHKGTIDIESDLQSFPEMMLLVPLGLFVGLQQNEESGAASASGSGG